MVQGVDRRSVTRAAMPCAGADTCIRALSLGGDDRREACAHIPAYADNRKGPSITYPLSVRLGQVVFAGTRQRPAGPITRPRRCGTANAGTEASRGWHSAGPSTHAPGFAVGVAPCPGRVTDRKPARSEESEVVDPERGDCGSLYRKRVAESVRNYHIGA